MRGPLCFRSELSAFFAKVGSVENRLGRDRLGRTRNRQATGRHRLELDRRLVRRVHERLAHRNGVVVLRHEG